MLCKTTYSLLLIVPILFSFLVPFSIADTVKHQYDALNRLIRVEYSECDIIEYTYDPAGNRTMQVV